MTPPVAVKLMEVVLHVNSVAEGGLIAATGNGLTVTSLLADVVPHAPVEVAVIVAVPENAASQFITPVAGSIIPAADGDTEYTIEVLLAAVAV